MISTAPAGGLLALPDSAQVPYFSGPSVARLRQAAAFLDDSDTNLIRAAIGLAPTVGDPRDANGDGAITLNDARACVLQCTRPNCAAN